MALCKYCNNVFKNEKKYGCVCENCKSKHHINKILTNAFKKS